MKKMPTYMLTRKIVEQVPSKSKKSVARASGKSQKASEIVITSGKSMFAARDLLLLRDLTKAVGRSSAIRAEIDTLEPSFKSALASSFSSIAARTRKDLLNGKPPTKATVAGRNALRTLIGRGQLVRVGVLDMGVWIGGLPSLLEKLNKAQSQYAIFEIQAPVPGGLVKTATGMNEWAAQKLGKRLSKRDRDGMEPQMIADEFFIVGEDIRKSMGLDFLIGITPVMVAGAAADKSVYWNHITSVFASTILLSAADLRDFAAQARRPFEAAIGAVLIPALMIAVNGKLAYHEDNGCLFDYNASRVSLIPTLKTMTVDAVCLGKMTKEQRAAAQGMIQALKRMRGRRTS